MIEYPLTDLDLSPFIISKEAVEPYLMPAPSLVTDTDNGSEKKKSTKKTKKQKILSTSEPIKDFSDSNISICSHSTDLDSTPASCSQLYDLYAVGNHHGGMTGGHYTAFCKNSVSKKWYLMDDDFVQEVSY